MGSASDSWSVPIPVSREFEPLKGPRCFLEQETLLLIALYWLVPGTDSSVIYINKKLKKNFHPPVTPINTMGYMLNHNTWGKRYTWRCRFIWNFSPKASINYASFMLRIKTWSVQCIMFSCTINHRTNSEIYFNLMMNQTLTPTSFLCGREG